ncbi:MAG: hypothetical protein QOD99_1073 [Chthoniobacter sp.]|nr:hypothetical protein [Chthoniobacter sp.]
MRLAELAALTFCATVLHAADPQIVSLLQQGDAEVSRRNLPAALGAFEQAEKIDPQNPEVLLRISQQNSDLIAEAPRPEEAKTFAHKALDFAERAVALAPRNAKAHLAVAVAYGRLTDFATNKAKLEYSRNVKIEATRAAELDPHEDYAFHVLGVWNYRVANLGAVMKLLAKIIYGGIPEASNEEAVRNFKKAIDLAPQRIIHHQELARVYDTSGKRELARKEWQTVLALPAQNSTDEKAQREAAEAVAKGSPLPRERQPAAQQTQSPERSDRPEPAKTGEGQ